MFMQARPSLIKGSIRNDFLAPQVQKKVDNLTFRILKADPWGSNRKIIEDTYKFWKTSWDETFRELNVKGNSFSDDFLNKEIGTLMLGDKPVGLLMYHFIDTKMSAFLESSYFKGYPSDLKDHLKSFHSPTMVITYMTLDKQWRQKNTDFSVPELLISFSVLRLLESPAARILGYFRKNKRTHEMFYRHGGAPLRKDAEAFNVKVDYAVIEREKARLSTHGNCNELALKKWNQFKNLKVGEPHAEHRSYQKRNGTLAGDFKEGALG